MVDQVDVQAEVDSLAAEIGLSVLIEDRAQRPVWWNTQGAVDGARAQTILDRHVTPVVASVVQRFHLLEATEPVRVPAVPEASMWARWCMPVRCGDRTLGLLWVLDPDGDLDEAALPRLLECAELAAEALAGSEESEERRHRRREALLERLLLGPDEEAARELSQLENLPLDARVQVEVPARPGGWALADGMSVHVARVGARPATSGAPLPVVQLTEAVRRASAVRRAVAAGAQLDPENWDALGAWRLIVEAPESLEPGDLHAGAVILAEGSNDTLMTTARVVLDHGGEVATAAKELHVHRTTLYYRLDRITELTGVDLRSGPSRTNLQLALWLAAYRAAAER
ncbi:helix-turn-helix domain-containing protein [Streptomyces sp. LHD-70]|uniref:helix-turn-helix domain-containing protein n=1 Tax=Streptomyces sp. LHD-70 TaxID=3072140 RepID=UPI00280E1E01|nr:helix-turn-helix domain-containing protein [Streptomyces sp. LHD-70]MDQ8705146.1 helix-turn-helix domain-containing protein [Streptomyces sp. LHD-70]